MEFAGISLSPWARQRIEWWPLVTTDGTALELCLKVARSFCTNSPHVPLLIEQFRHLDICQFDPDETMPPAPQFTMDDFRSEKQFQQYSELRILFFSAAACFNNRWSDGSTVTNRTNTAGGICGSAVVFRSSDG